MSSLKKNITYHVLYQVLLLIIPLITTPYIARVIGVDGVGTYSYTYSITQYFTLFIMLGLNNYGNRTIAKCRNNKEKLSDSFWNIFAMQSLCAHGDVLLFGSFLLLYGTNYKELFVVESLFIIASGVDINWFFFGMEKFKMTVIRNLIIKVLSLIAIFIFVRSESDLVFYALILALSALLTNIVLWPYIFKNIRFVKPKKKKIIHHLKANLTLFIPVIAISIYNIMDKIMIGYFVNVYQVGLYENSERIINVPLNIITALGTVMMPRVSNLLSEKKEEESKILIRKSFVFSMFFAFPMMLALIGVSRDLVTAYLGDDFAEATIYVQLLSIIIIFKVWANIIRTQFLIPHELDKPYIKSVAFGAVINFILNIILINIIGAIGAVVGTIITEIFVAIYQTNAVKNALPIREYVLDSIPFISKSIIVLVVVLAAGYIQFGSLIIKICVQAILGSIAYVLLNCRFIIKTIHNAFSHKKSVNNQTR